MRTTIVAIATLGVAISGVGVAQAAPGDCLVLGGQLVCEAVEETPPLTSVCTPLEPVGNLPRSSCQTIVRETGELIGDPQVFTYPPRNDLEAPVVEVPRPREPYVPPTRSPAPTVRNSEPTAAPRTPAAPVAPVAVEVPVPSSAAPATVDAVPTRPAPAGPAAAHRRTWVDTVDAVAPWVGLAALFVLVFAVAYRPKPA